MYQYERIEFFWALALIPLLVLAFLLARSMRKRALMRFGEPKLLEKMFPEVSTSKRTWKFIFYTLAMGFLIVGLVNPQAGKKKEEVKRTGADLMICLDVSNSMKAEDLSPNRLERAKMAISRLLDNLEGDRVGIIVFGGEAYVQLPITTDYSAAKLFLESISTDMIPTQGTAIGKAIDKAMESFGKDEGKNKAIIIITDGENHEDDAVKAAEDAADKGITIHTIGMGSADGAPIPVYQGEVRQGFRKDKDGNTIMTKLNEQSLQEIAAAGNGIYVRASNSDAGLNAVLAEVDKLEKKQISSKIFKDYEDRFQWFISAALLFLLTDTFLSERKSRLYKKLNLFGDAK